MSTGLAAMGPGALGTGVSTATVPRSALGPGVSLHAYDIAVLVVYFVFVIGVGVWVSSPEVGGGQGRQRQALINGWSWSWGQGWAEGRRVQEAQGLMWKDLKGSSSPTPPFRDGQLRPREGCDLPELTQRAPICRPTP